MIYTVDVRRISSEAAQAMYEEAAPEALGLEQLEELETMARDVSAFLRRINPQEDFMKNKALQNSLNGVSAKNLFGFYGLYFSVFFPECMNVELYLMMYPYGFLSRKLFNTNVVLIFMP